LIDELANVAAGSKKHKQSKLAKLEAKAANYATLNSRLGALDDALEAIETTTDFREYAVSLEDGAAFSVKATGEAIAGSYDVTVNSLAQAQIEQIYVDGSNSFASQTTALFSGAQAGDTFDITVDGELTQISITSSTNLATLASSIDDIDGLTAYVIQTATEEATGADAFALVVQADDTGKYEGADRF
jgi:flagellar hook-associated protein 2